MVVVHTVEWQAWKPMEDTEISIINRILVALLLHFSLLSCQCLLAAIKGGLFTPTMNRKLRALVNHKALGRYICLCRSMYQEVQQKGYAFNMLVHCDESDRVVTYDGVLGMIQVLSCCMSKLVPYVEKAWSCHYLKLEQLHCCHCHVIALC